MKKILNPFLTSPNILLSKHLRYSTANSNAIKKQFASVGIFRTKYAYFKFRFALLVIMLGQSVLYAQQVTGIYTDYGGYWASSAASINPVKPDNSHNMLGFTWNGTTYSTSVNDALLTSNGVAFTPLSFRALPINSVPLSGSSYFVMLGQKYDGVNNGVSPGGPFSPNPNAATLASFLTDGIKGLNLGTGLTNIPAGSTLIFQLSSNGISLSAIGDGKPDLFITQLATIGSSNDIFDFIDASGNTVGNVVTINQGSLAQIGNWTADFYSLPTASQTDPTFIDSDRPMRFFATDLSAFGINATNYHNIVALRYQPSGTSDPAFIAYNEPSISIASKLTITTAPSGYVNNTALYPNPVIQLRDGSGQIVQQAGVPITAFINTGSGTLAGTITVNTDANGVASFSNLQLSGSGIVTLSFQSSSLDPAISGNIADNNPIPLTWLDNTVYLNSNKQAVIKWTVQEKNVAGYKIEKSFSNDNFNVIGTMGSKSDGENNYSFTEDAVLARASYYRITQTDIDGKSSYSSIMPLMCDATITSFGIYPNPAKDHANISIDLENDQTIQYKIIDEMGRLLFQNTAVVKAGHNTISIATNGYAAGTYHVVIKGKNTTGYAKLLKL